MSATKPGGLTSPEAAIRQAVEEFTRAYNAGEFEKLEGIFDENLIDMSAGGPTRRGAEARRHFVLRVKETHAKFQPHLKINIDELQVAGDWAYEHGTLVVELMPRTGGDKSYIRQRYLDIWRRQPSGQWKIAIEMDNSAESST